MHSFGKSSDRLGLYLLREALLRKSNELNQNLTIRDIHSLTLITCRSLAITTTLMVKRIFHTAPSLHNQNTIP